MIPSGLKEFAVQSLISKGFALQGDVVFEPVHGGCINQAGRLAVGDRSFFIKWNSLRRYPGMFELEFEGLRLLRNHTSLHVPEPLLFDEDGDHGYLIMEWIPKGVRSGNFWETLGQQLADLHRPTAGQFGLDKDNFIGSLRQLNTQKDSWIDFFRTCRLEPTFRWAMDRGLFSSSDHVAFRKFLEILPERLATQPKPSLIHGDLWSGNLITGPEGEPCLVDPAVYFADREVEVAFTTLFGRFGEAFYSAYRESYPLEPGFEERFEIYNLYPILVHVNLFGASYVGSARTIIQNYV